jgi:hypothetical protein
MGWLASTGVDDLELLRAGVVDGHQEVSTRSKALICSCRQASISLRRMLLMATAVVLSETSSFFWRWVDSSKRTLAIELARAGQGHQQAFVVLN